MNKEKIKSGFIQTCSSVIIGIICGLGGSLFHSSTEIVNTIRINNPWLIYLLPFAGVLIVWVYKLCKIPPTTNSKPVFNSSRNGEKVNPLLSVAIFLATCLTHLFGASTGREGAALQFGGSLGSATGQILKFDKKKNRIAVICGMASGFTAMFGTPITAAVFTIEATDVTLGLIYTCNFIYVIISVFVSALITYQTGYFGMNFSVPNFELNYNNAFYIAIITAACSAISVVFILGNKYVGLLANKYFKNDYFRIFIGGAIVLLLSLIWNSGEYNGVGTEVISNIMSGNFKPEAFIIKLIFTVVSLSFGYKGGELIPILFIGASLGALIGSLFGVSVIVAAAIGMICVFSAATRCPFSAIVMGVEIFGYNLLPCFLFSCMLAYFISGNIDFYDKKSYKPGDLIID